MPGLEIGGGIVVEGSLLSPLDSVAVPLLKCDAGAKHPWK